MKCFFIALFGFYLSYGAASAGLIMLNTVYGSGENLKTDSTGTYDGNFSLVSYTDWYGSNTTTNFSGNATHAYLVSTTNTATFPTGYWTNDTAAGSWIGQVPVEGTGSAGTLGSLAGVYDYQLTFVVTGTQTVLISGDIAADNQYAIALTGTTTYVGVDGPGSTGTSTNPASSSYVFVKGNSSSEFGGTYGDNAPLAFSFTGTATGTMTLDFFVNNLQEGTSTQDNASGLYVEDLEIQVVPEPPTWMILLAGLGLVAFARHRARPAPQGILANLRKFIISQVSV
jgi:hypothetical protein